MDLAPTRTGLPNPQHGSSWSSSSWARGRKEQEDEWKRFISWTEKSTFQVSFQGQWYQKHTPFHIYFFRQSFENCLSLLSAALLLLHVASRLRCKHRERRNQRDTQDSEPSSRRPFLHLLHAFRAQSCTSLSDTDPPPTRQARSNHGKAKGFRWPCCSQQQSFLYSRFYTSLQFSTTRS